MAVVFPQVAQGVAEAILTRRDAAVDVNGAHYDSDRGTRVLRLLRDHVQQLRGVESRA